MSFPSVRLPFGVLLNEMFRKLVRLRVLEEELRQQEKLFAIGRAALRIAHDINRNFQACVLEPQPGRERTERETGSNRGSENDRQEGSEQLTAEEGCEKDDLGQARTGPADDQCH